MPGACTLLKMSAGGSPGIGMSETGSSDAAHRDDSEEVRLPVRAYFLGRLGNMLGPVYFSDRVGPTGPVRSVKMAVYFTDQVHSSVRGRVLR